jgi:hypothetical protein
MPVVDRQLLLAAYALVTEMQCAKNATADMLRCKVGTCLQSCWDNSAEADEILHAIINKYGGNSPPKCITLSSPARSPASLNLCSGSINGTASPLSSSVIKQHVADDLSDDDNFESWLNYESEEDSDDEEETKKLM